MAKADFLELAGQVTEAQEIARNVLSKAQAMDYAIIVLRAKEHSSGEGFRSKQDSIMRKKTEEEKVIRNATEAMKNRMYMLSKPWKLWSYLRIVFQLLSESISQSGNVQKIN